MDMKFKEPFFVGGEVWHLKDESIIIGGTEYGFCEIKEVEELTSSIAVIGLRDRGTISLYYKDKDSENAKLAAKYLIEKVENTEYNPTVSASKMKTIKHNLGCIFTIIMTILTALIGFNLSYGNPITRTFALFGFALIGLIFSFIISALLNTIPQKIGAVFKPLLMIIIVGALCVGVVFTFGMGGHKSSWGNHNKNDYKKCAMCGDKVPEYKMIGDWCKDCNEKAFGEDGWYDEIKD